MRLREVSAVALVGLSIVVLSSKSCSAPDADTGRLDLGAHALPRFESAASPRRASPPADVPAPAVTTPLPRRRFQLVDIGLHGAMAGVTLRAVQVGDAPSSVETVTTTESGAAELALSGSFRASIESAGVRLVWPTRTYDQEGDILCYRMATVRCDIQFADAPDARPMASLFAAPTDRVGGEWVPDESRVGSSEWLRKNAHSLRVTHGSATSTPAVIDVPMFSEMTLAAAAPGYLPDTAVARFTPGGPTEAEVHLTLRRASRIVVEVTDESGVPISGARFQYAVQRRTDRASTNPAVEFLLADAGGGALTSRSSGPENWTEVDRITGSTTDANGIAGVDQPAAGSTEVLIVWADKCRPFVLKRPVTTSAEDVVQARLERFEPICPRYRFVADGKVVRGASLYLAERIGGGFTPALPTIDSDAEGWVDSALLVPGRTYLGSVVDHSKKRGYSGEFVFGPSCDVDISKFTH